MILEIFIILLLISKSIGLIDLSWSITIVILLSLSAVALQLELNKRAILKGLLSGAQVVDDRLDDFEYRLNQKQDKEYD